jgi:prephenate dehydrogenase
MGAERHDRLVAAVSDLPYLLSAALGAAASSAEGEDPLLPVLASSGFRDTSRLAGSDVAMMRDILFTNRGPVLQTLADCRAWLDKIAALLEAGDDEGLTGLLADIRAEQGRLRS